MSGLTKVKACPQQTPARCGTVAAPSCSHRFSSTHNQLFAERGFAAVDDRGHCRGRRNIHQHLTSATAPTKEGLLVDPVPRGHRRDRRPRYNARPPDESAVEALIQVFVHACPRRRRARQSGYLRHAGRYRAPPMSKTVLVSEIDHDQVHRAVASRMGVDASS